MVSGYGVFTISSGFLPDSLTDLIDDLELGEIGGLPGSDCRRYFVDKVFVWLVSGVSVGLPIIRLRSCSSITGIDECSCTSAEAAETDKR